MVAAIAAASVAVRAAGPTFWVTSTQADLLKGESDGVSVDELGRILAGPALATTADSSRRRRSGACAWLPTAPGTPAPVATGVGARPAGRRADTLPTRRRTACMRSRSRPMAV